MTGIDGGLQLRRPLVTVVSGPELLSENQKRFRVHPDRCNYRQAVSATVNCEKSLIMK
jgi:hypothetical protein